MTEVVSNVVYEVIGRRVHDLDQRIIDYIVNVLADEDFDFGMDDEGAVEAHGELLVVSGCVYDDSQCRFVCSKLSERFGKHGLIRPKPAVRCILIPVRMFDGMDEEEALKKKVEVIDGPVLTGHDRAKIQRRKRKDDRKREMQYQMHLQEMEATKAEMPVLCVSHDGGGVGPNIRDLHLVHFSFSVGGRELIFDGSVALSFGRHYGLVGRNETGKTSFLRHLAMHAIDSNPKNFQILHVEHEVLGDTTIAFQCVLNTDLESILLLEEEARLLAMKRDLEMEAEAAQSNEDLNGGADKDVVSQRLEQIYIKLEHIDGDSAEAHAASILTTFINKFLYNAKRASLVQSRIKALNLRGFFDEVVNNPDYKFEFPTPDDRRGPPVISFSDASFGYSGCPVLFNNDIDLHSQITMVGANIIAKSIIVKFVTEKLQRSFGTVFRLAKMIFNPVRNGKLNSIAIFCLCALTHVGGSGENYHQEPQYGCISRNENKNYGWEVSIFMTIIIGLFVSLHPVIGSALKKMVDSLLMSLIKLAEKADLLVYDRFLTAKQDMFSLLSRSHRALPKQQFHTNPITELPDDMIMEVMSRCSSIDVLATFRASCKSLNALAYDSKYITSLPIFSGFLQLHNMGRVAKFIDGTNSEGCPRPDISMNFLPTNRTIKAFSDTTGLLFCISSQQFYLCKPTTNEWLQISNYGGRDFGTYGLIVISRNPLHFKILRVFTDHDWSIYRSQYVSQLYDSKTPGRWRTLKQVLRLRKGSEHIIGKLPVTVNGHMHFLVHTGRVFAFDALRESWKTFSLPPESICKGTKCLMKYKGKLSLLLMDVYDVGLQKFWMMDDYGRKVWTKKSYHQVYFNDYKIMRMKSLSFFDFADSDFESYIMLWNKLWRRDCLFHDSVVHLQSDFQKMGWALDAKSMEGEEVNDHIETREREKVIFSFIASEPFPFILFGVVVLFLIISLIYFLSCSKLGTCYVRIHL